MSQKPEAPPVLVAADDADVAAVRAALGPSAHVTRFEGDPRGGLGPVSVVVSSTVAKAGAGAAAWLALAPQGGPAPALVLLADVADERAVAQWLDDGGHDWVFREHLGVLPAVLERLRSEREAREQLEQRLRASTAALVQVARSPRFKSDDLDAVLREIAEAAARGLASARCGVWLFDDNHAVLRQMAQFDARSNTHTKGFALSVHAHDAHFAALRSQRLVATVHPQADARPQQPDGEHAQPVAFTSTIDVSVQLGGELIGLLRIEYFGAPHRLSASEEAFATAMTDVLSLILEGSERSQFESTLLKGERRFRDLFQHTTDALVLYRVALDGNVYFEDINPAAEVASGLKRDDVIGRQAHEVFAPRTSQHMKERYAEAIRTRAPIAYDESLELPAGQRAFSTVIVPLPDETGRIDRLAAVARDITAQREAEARQRTLEAQLTEAQKNEALVRLASHIAHDVNNLLTVVMANAQRLESLPGRPAEVAQAILQATNRGRELTQQVLTFSRRRPPERKRLELGPMVRETLKLLEVTAPDVMMRVELPARPVVVQGDSSQLRQVVTNLCTNALTAMAGSKGAKLTLRLDLIELDYAFAQQHPPLQAGRWARLVVEDTGESLDDAARRRIFEPFFSSGAQGRGTGLGLAVVQSIVQGHDGAVVVERAPTRGTQFIVYLPALEEDLVRPGAGRHLMLVDDHPGMARVSARLLETLGYQTSAFDDPREALAAFRGAPGSFDAIMTDLSMPQMSGEEFTRSVRLLAPKVPVIVSSGLAGELDLEELKSLGISAVLMKPWRLEEAIATLQRILPGA